MPNEPSIKPEQCSTTPTSTATLFHGLSKQQLIVAFAIAAVSDLISAFVTFMPPVEWGVDLATAILLFMVLGWRWLLLPGIIMEAIPGFGVFPFWLLVVGAIALWGTARPKLPRDSAAPIER